MSDGQSKPRKTTVGYLVSEYPAPSHTFIRREVEALRAMGVLVKTYSVHPSKHKFADAKGRNARAETYSILSTSKISIALSILFSLRRPIKFLSVLSLALRHRTPGVKALVWAFFHYAEAIVLAGRLRRDGVTHLHNHFANAGATVGLLAARLNDIPWSFTIHGISEFDYPAGNLIADKLERAAFAACVSYFGMAQAMRLSQPRLWPKLNIVRCALDPEDLPPKQVGATGEEIQLICVGRLSAEKGQLGLLQAFHDLLQGGVVAQMTLVGDGPQSHLIKAEARRLGIERRVEFKGALDEGATLRAISHADILVLPSFMEGLPIVLMEGLAMRVPVVASRVAGIPELVKHEISGMLFDPANWAELTAALQKLASDPDLRQRLAKNGYREVSARFFYPSAALPLLSLFDGASTKAEQESDLACKI